MVICFPNDLNKSQPCQEIFWNPLERCGYSYPVVVVDVQERAHCLYNGHLSRHTLCMYS